MGETRVRIVCTLGPASADVRILSRMIMAGMRIARLNFSHGTHQSHAAVLKALRLAEKRTGISVAVLQDLSGVKLRVGDLPASGLKVHDGQVLTLPGDIPFVGPASYVKALRVGMEVFFDDGMLAGEVQRVRGGKAFIAMRQTGVLHAHKGINFPAVDVSQAALTLKDRDDLVFGVEQGVDAVAVSFVTSPEILRDVRRRTRGQLLFAKIERRMAIAHFDDIARAADGVLLGRGDLGVEVPFAEVPIIQKDLAHRSRELGKPFIVETHMLESMRLHPRATRAEVSDVATAVFDGADAVMLSAESATGAYPVDAVQTMHSVIATAEASFYAEAFLPSLPDDTATHMCGPLLALLAQHQWVDAIVVPYSLAPALLAHRPHVPCFVAVAQEQQARQALFLWGAQTVLVDIAPATFVARAKAILRRTKRIPHNARVAFIVPDGVTGWTLQYTHFS